METTRHIGHAPLADAVTHRIMTLDSRCLGCEDCKGVCAALVQMMTLAEPAAHHGGRA